MQIDFHHAVTYVTCRLAGLSKPDAEIVAYSAQYVDDATNDGVLAFRSGERYVRATSAHKMADIRNIDEADNRQIWVPFHFLPGAEPKTSHPAGVSSFVGAMVCRPNSTVAQSMMRHVVRNKANAFPLHRLGIALHTFVDTWAHQEFVGVVDDFNKVERLKVENRTELTAELYQELNGGINQFLRAFTDLLPVGHAGAMTFPDLPFLKWSFIRANGQLVIRDNKNDFVEAAKHMFNWVRRFRSDNHSLPMIDFEPADKLAIQDLLWETKLIDGESRHQVWIDEIGNGRFSLGAENVTYVPKGPGSWKSAAVGTNGYHDTPGQQFQFTDEFLSSDWKRFHDALHYQRNYVLKELLPTFKVVAS
jgi:hypothetical protein